jgi:hypothetical protein
MFTPGLIMTPFPILAPNNFKRKIFKPEEGFNGLIKNNTFTTYHNTRFKGDPG